MCFLLNKCTIYQLLFVQPLQMSISAVRMDIMFSIVKYAVGNSTGVNRMQDTSKYRFIRYKEKFIIGNHRNCRFLMDIFSEQNYPSLTVSFEIHKWIVIGNCEIEAFGYFSEKFGKIRTAPNQWHTYAMSFDIHAGPLFL